MLEKDIEKTLFIEAKKHGGMALKFISPTMAGVPDRLLLLPGGKIAFVELKSKGKTLRPLQKKRKIQLQSLGFMVFVVDDKEQIGGVIDGISKMSVVW